VEVEDVLVMHTALLPTAVIGIPDSKSVQTPTVAFVTDSAQSMSADELIAIVRAGARSDG
jgi:acyl-coenzyme A synthetase/AMP-(fatty) acid ligase